MNARLLLVGAAALSTLTGLRALDERQEPPARFELELDGKTYAIDAGEAFEVTVAGETLPARLVALPTKVLRAAGVAFEYPVGTTFEYEREFGLEIWTLDGNDTVLMLMRIAVPSELDDFVAEQRAAYEAFGDPTVHEASLGLEGATVAGRRLEVEADAFALAVEYFPVGPEGSTKLMLCLQDVRDDLSEPTEEFVALRKMISDTFRRTEE